MKRRGVTLLEMLAALALLLLVIGAASSWLVGMTRTERSMREHTSERAWLGRAADLLRSDLAGAWPGSIEIDESRRVVRAVVPNQPTPALDDSLDERGEPPAAGWIAIEWSYDPVADTLRRSRSPIANSGVRAGTASARTRNVLVGVTGWSVDRVDTDPGDGAESDTGTASYEITIAFASETRTVRWSVTP
ncbi:MAG: prepilin-type N-terminal cleavage/methylation domain-containing protein [Phycisphaerales bacterium]|nr:prepilin-type N-terminal cleavage/methylation domain-containing protein [Phycisphaerales bacterium]